MLPFSGDKGGRRSEERVSFSVPFCPALSNLLRNQLNRVFFYGDAFVQSRQPFLRRHDDRCRRNKIAKSPTGLPGRFKIPLTKGISSYWYQHRRFGYISLVTFGSRWTPSTRRRRSRRAGGPNRCELLAIGHRARSNNTRKPVRALCFFLHPPGAGCSPFYLSVLDSVLPRFHVKLLRIRGGEICIL